MRAETQSPVHSEPTTCSVLSSEGMRVSSPTFISLHSSLLPVTLKKHQQLLKNLWPELILSHLLCFCSVKKKKKTSTSIYTNLPPNNEGNGKLIRTEAATEHPADQVRVKVSIRSGSVAHPVGQMLVYFKCY